ncbi:hypothetical protein GLAREA_09389 [Glarea lozoyensis ATCC 20868]|uniref:MARVEL domain-containing protein n=1 Tax=Glarea lozoyensis (strain ATCC 20868 / MF5171) TaxID=1116229 RepID=S3CTA2_GLAL2|nr:uncharacterized protein GLAREA_09389 [Glarea lozoyensis ATCC 20868]EPE28269.1 hypothetical protein GLAREA_09389 [Glarea lozoyensis ATCC 20868]
MGLKDTGTCGLSACLFTTQIIGRLLSFACAITVFVLVGVQIERTHDAGASIDSKLTYTMILSGIAMLDITLIFTKWRFVSDLVLTIMWLVDASTLSGIDGSLSCEGSWQHTVWGYCWGRFFGDVIPGLDPSMVVGSSGCYEWRLVIILAYLAMSVHVVNYIIDTNGCIWKVGADERKLFPVKMREDRQASVT